MYIEANSSELRDKLRAYLDHVAATGDRVLITRYNGEMAALVSVRDFELLEKVENGREEFLEHRHAQQMEEFRRMKAGMEEGVF